MFVKGVKNSFRALGRSEGFALVGNPARAVGHLFVHLLKMNAVARAKLKFQMLILLQEYLYRQSQY